MAVAGKKGNAGTALEFIVGTTARRELSDSDDIRVGHRPQRQATGRPAGLMFA